MEKEVKSTNMITTWDNHLDKKYGKRGTASRTDFEVKAHNFFVKDVLIEERTKVASPKKTMADLWGKLSEETGDELNRLVEEERNGWEERLNKRN
jgi:hypothetical protein